MIGQNPTPPSGSTELAEVLRRGQVSGFPQ